jgi:hypothetical protein
METVTIRAWERLTSVFLVYSPKLKLHGGTFELILRDACFILNSSFLSLDRSEFMERFYIEAMYRLTSKFGCDVNLSWRQSQLDIYPFCRSIPKTDVCADDNNKYL